MDGNPLEIVNTIKNDTAPDVSVIQSAGSKIYQYTMIMGIISVIAIAVIVGLFIKAITQKKKIKSEISINTINSIKIVAILILVFNILSLNINIPAIIISIIAIVFACNAKNEFESNFESAKAKANTAAILNIVSSGLIVIFWILVFGMSIILELIEKSFMG